MKLAKYKACICEGSAESAIIDILVDNNSYPQIQGLTKNSRRLERKVARRLQRKTHAVCPKFAGLGLDSPPLQHSILCKRKHYYISKYIPRNFLTHNKIHAKTRAHKCFRNYFCKKQSHGIEYCSFVLEL